MPGLETKYFVMLKIHFRIHDIHAAAAEHGSRESEPFVTPSINYTISI
jgi:hypothetical protein